MKILTKIQSIIFSFIQRALFLFEFFLFLRLLLKFFGANPETPVVALIYQYSGPFISPFNFIFPDIYLSKGYLIEIATVSAMIGYAILVFLIVQLLKVFSKD